jgi:predicted amidohydrolase
MTVKIATAQYDISFLENWQAYQGKVESWVVEATAQDAKILLLPEYFSMELASLFGPEIYSSLSKQLAAMQSLHDDFYWAVQKSGPKIPVYYSSGDISSTNRYWNLSKSGIFVYA